MMTVKESVFYSVPVVCLLALCMMLPSCQAEPSSEPPTEPSKTTVQETPAVSSISVDELKDKLENGSPIMLVDVRNRDDFLTNHIKGAVSIPLDEIPDRYQEIPQDKEVIVYADCA
jgi:3-mercaptopyruvate sulfurtransferase SseA